MSSQVSNAPAFIPVTAAVENSPTSPTNPHEGVSIVLAATPAGVPLLSIVSDADGNHLLLHAPNGAPRVRLTADDAGGYGQFTDERGVPLLLLHGPSPSVDLADRDEPAGVFIASLHTEGEGGRLTLGANTPAGPHTVKLGF